MALKPIYIFCKLLTCYFLRSKGRIACSDHHVLSIGVDNAWNLFKHDSVGTWQLKLIHYGKYCYKFAARCAFEGNKGYES